MRPRLAKGFTLIELIVAVSLLAVLSIIAWRGLDSVLKARDTLTDVGEDMRSLTIAFAQLDEDLRRSWPMRQLLPAQQAIAFKPAGAGAGAQLELLREGGGALDGIRVERVAYRVRDGKLERGFASYAAGASAQLSEFEWQPILQSVNQFSMKAWVQGTGWIAAENMIAAAQEQQRLAAASGTAAVSPAGAAPAPGAASATGTAGAAAAAFVVPPATLGIDMQLTRANGQVFTRIFSVRD
jgi:general secretion pathway protein J